MTLFDAPEVSPAEIERHERAPEPEEPLTMSRLMLFLLGVALLRLLLYGIFTLWSLA